MKQIQTDIYFILISLGVVAWTIYEVLKPINYPCSDYSLINRTFDTCLTYPRTR